MTWLHATPAILEGTVQSESFTILLVDGTDPNVLCTGQSRNRGSSCLGRSAGKLQAWIGVRSNDGAEPVRSTILLLLTVCLTSVLYLFPSARAAVPGARIQNDSSYILYGTYHMVGEVLNTGDVPLRFIAITATFKDQN